MMRDKGRKKDRETAVVVVDIQGDFTEYREGSLAVPGTGKDYIDDVERAVRLLKAEGYPILGTQDWHPAGHISFSTNHEGKKPGDIVPVDGRQQILWPAHCVQGSDNAEVLIDHGLFTGFIKKGSHPRYDSYSGFRDDGGNETGLDDLLLGRGITAIVIFGLATDYCTKYTSLDAIEKGYSVTVVEELSRGITAETTAAAIEEMARKGVIIMKKLDMTRIETR